MYYGIKFTGVMNEMTFEKYMHILRITDPLPSDLDGLLEGKVWVFPKLDGACHSVFWDEESGEVRCASRNKMLSQDHDETGFQKYLDSNTWLKEFVMNHKDWTIYGEFMTPHTIRNYTDCTWKHFHIFDVMKDGKFLPYEQYMRKLSYECCHCLNLRIIIPMAVVNNPSVDFLKSYVDSNHFCMKDDGVGEGIVVKNYDFTNCYGRTVWGKIIREDFRSNPPRVGKDAKEFTAEEIIVDKYVTKEFVSKEFHKFTDDRGVDWNDRMIPDFLHYIWEQWWLDYSLEVVGMSKDILDLKALRKSANQMFVRYLKSL